VPALLDTRSRLTRGFAAHGLGDLQDRSIVKRRAVDVVTYLYPPRRLRSTACGARHRTSGGTARLSGLPPVNRQWRALRRVRQSISAGSLIVIVLLSPPCPLGLHLLALVRPRSRDMDRRRPRSGVSLDLFSMLRS
jgi:hypothetical protein